MTAPPKDTVEAWAWNYIVSTELSHKLSPPPLPSSWESAPPVRDLRQPGRPPELRVTTRAPKTPRPGALRNPQRRAQLLHSFLHHELQAAELMCWALLRFPDTDPGFRRGLIGICSDEIRHMNMYLEHIRFLGSACGDFPVRDWFWLRIPHCETPEQFVATLGIGLEGGNLDHAHRFAGQLREAGDERAAGLQERVGREEIAHVRFARRWFARWHGGVEVDFDSWRQALPKPLSPILMRSRPLNRAHRLESGLSTDFVDRLDAWEPIH